MIHSAVLIVWNKESCNLIITGMVTARVGGVIAKKVVT